MKSTRPKISLIIMAAGTGVGFGGLKQFAQVGPNREMLWEYSLYDAMSLGFSEAVFVVRKEILDAFQRIIEKKIKQKFPVRFVTQEIPEHLKGERSKPMGTGHALLSARNKQETPFLVINSDDFYSRETFHRTLSHMANSMQNGDDFEPLLATYPIERTLSEFGPVSRAICKIDASGYLIGLQEFTDVQLRKGKIIGLNGINETEEIPHNTMVSMNCWLGEPRFFPYLDKEFHLFLEHLDNPVSGSFDLPSSILASSLEYEVPIKSLSIDCKWMGLTHHEDQYTVKDKLSAMHSRKEYPNPLWK